MHSSAFVLFPFSHKTASCVFLSSLLILLHYILHLPSKHLPFRPHFSFSSPYFIALIFLNSQQTSNWKDALHKQIPSLFIYGHNVVKMRLQNSFPSQSVENGVEKLIFKPPWRCSHSFGWEGSAYKNVGTHFAFFSAVQTWTAVLQKNVKMKLEEENAPLEAILVSITALASAGRTENFFIVWRNGWREIWVAVQNDLSTF